MERLRALRQEKGVSQQRLAEILGVSQQSVYKYENGLSEPSISILMNLAEYFHTSVDYIIGYTDVREQTKNKLILSKNIETVTIYQSMEKIHKKYPEEISQVSNTNGLTGFFLTLQIENRSGIRKQETILEKFECLLSNNGFDISGIMEMTTYNAPVNVKSKKGHKKWVKNIQNAWKIHYQNLKKEW